MFRAIFAVLFTLWVSAPAHASKPQLLSVWVLDANGRPIPNAWVRIPGTEGRREVDAATGVWEASMLYTYDGRSVFFMKGDEVEITVSAPGYEAQTIKWMVKPRKNEFDVRLRKMPEVKSTDVFDESIEIDWFKPLPGEEDPKKKKKAQDTPKDKPAPKAEEKPAPKAEEKPAPKAEEKPAPKAEEKPAPKVEEKPAPKVEEKPAPKAEEKPAEKAEEKPAPKAEDKP